MGVPSNCGPPFFTIGFPSKHWMIKHWLPHQNLHLSSVFLTTGSMFNPKIAKKIGKSPKITMLLHLSIATVTCRAKC